MAIDVLCVGHAAFDTSLFLDGFPEENGKLEVADLLTSGGGPAANAACLLAHWGLATAFAGVVGDDVYGKLVLQDFRTWGVDPSLTESRPGHTTPFSTILVNTRNGSRTIINRKVDTPPLTLSSVALSNLSPRVLLADGHELAAAEAALQRFPDAFSILDAGSVRAGTLALAHRVDALVASERFARTATGFSGLQSETDLRECLLNLQEQFARPITVITLGERGLVADVGNGFYARAAETVAAVDTTAAGDMFHGAVAYGIVQGWTWPVILNVASRAAALSVTRRGGRQSIPTLAEVLGDG